MSKYYKAEDVAFAIADREQFESEVSRPYKVFLDSAKDLLKDLPTIDIVHCGDCRHNNRETICEIEENWCEIFNDTVASDDFCSYGEKQVAGKLKNPDDSLLAEDSEDCKEQKSKLDLQPTCNQFATDLISRQAAIEALGEEPDIALDTEEEWAECDAWARHIRAIESLPSVPRPVREDAISRQAVEEMIKAEMPERGMWEIEGDKEKETVCEVCVDLMQKLSECPPVEPQRPKGEWHLVDHLWQCDRCQYRQNKLKPTNFCPGCGASMKGDTENDR